MSIVVTRHAIKRYRQRLCDYASSDDKIVKLLRNVVANGKRIYLRPSSQGHCIEVKYRGISVVVVNESNKTTVITCLGDKTYRKWVKNKDSHSCYGRLLYPESDSKNRSIFAKSK